MNSFGRLFRISIYGESHSSALGIVIDGCPPGLRINSEELSQMIINRQPKSKGTTSRIEKDFPKFLSGILNNVTTGAPINILFENNNIISKDYTFVKSTPRPGHSDFVANRKYFSFNDYRGGGAFSGRMTLAIVAAGAIAKLLIGNIQIKASIISIHGNKNIDEEMDKSIELNDSVGGIVECRTSGVPIGFGEPHFDSFESVLSHLVFSIPGIIGIEFGAGFNGVSSMYGSEFNDRYINSEGHTASNNSGGINGGITNGNEIIFRVAVKPTSSIYCKQETYNFSSDQITELEIKGRHDTCIALRVKPIIEAVTAIVLADFYLIRNSQISFQKQL